MNHFEFLNEIWTVWTKYGLTPSDEVSSSLMTSLGHADVSKFWKYLKSDKIKNPVFSSPLHIFQSNFVNKPHLTRTLDTWQDFGHLPDLRILQTRVPNTHISEKRTISLSYFCKIWSGYPNWQNEMISSKNYWSRDYMCILQTGL